MVISLSQAPGRVGHTHLNCEPGSPTGSSRQVSSVSSGAALAELFFPKGALGKSRRVDVLRQEARERNTARGTNGKDVVAEGYRPDLLPRIIRDQTPSGLRFLIYRTSPGSIAPADEWIRDNYGLDRYQVPVTVRNAWDVTRSERLDGLPVILTTGSIVDLGRKDDYPWIRTFRETVLRQAVDRGLPVIAPCYGLAELAQLYAQPGQDAFPKGVRELGARPIEVISAHPIFYGLRNLTAYTHHNGSVPLDLLAAYRNQLQLHAITRDARTGKIVPALVSFGGLATIGTSFHREILDEEAKVLFERAVTRKIDKLEQSAKFQQLNLSRQRELLEDVRASIRETHRVDRLQEVMNRLFDEPENVLWITEYLAGSKYEQPSEGYKRLASFVFFDNLLRLGVATHTRLSLPQTGIGETIEIQHGAHRERTPLRGFIKDGQLYTAEIIGTSSRELQEMTELYIHGFGDHLPMQPHEHKQIAEKGDVIAIRNADGVLVAMRSLVYSAEDANPYDKHVSQHHAYQNHTVVHRDWRGKGLVEEMTDIAVRITKEKNKEAIITSVSPANIANLRALLRQGFVVSIYSPDHFGPGEHRYMLELSVERHDQSQRYDNSLEASDDIPTYTGNGSGSLYKIETTDTAKATALLEQRYVGVSTITGNNNYLVFRKSSTADNG